MEMGVTAQHIKGLPTAFITTIYMGAHLVGGMGACDFIYHTENNQRKNRPQ